MNIWEQLKARISARISTEAYQNWLSKTVFLKAEGGTLWVAVPDRVTKEWIEQEYAAEIASVIVELRLHVTQVLYEIRPSDTRGAADDRNELVFAPAISLNPKFTFETFVVGSCNQFAHAAAHAVATNPAKTYNPLFIYGGVGMGKTHLMHAIGRSLVDHYAGMRIIYTSSERFMNEMVTCIKSDRMQLFHRHYRSADVLLIDDIQILAGKDGTQEEFFHTFNELFEHQKQIVISSDSPPKSLPGLVERLRSRFEWGLMVDVLPPDLETKMAILDKKAEMEGLKLPEEVRIFIATKTKSNVRELEGALVKLMAYSSVTGTPITLAMAQQLLKHLSPGGEKRITIESIARVVAENFSLQVSQLKQKTNEQKIAYPRQITMYLVKELTSASLPEIGRWFSGKHHTTVLHSVQKIEKLRQRDPDLNNLLHKLVDSIH
ncbi:MAG TPA: chromosomal replication initiator protein DnaA [Bryobacteraceae bacterium]|nr:chromosomal replication initiator protein DnaA [Bryobacteraceae bacterium]